MHQQFANWHLLLRLYLKRDCRKIIIWILGLGTFSAGFLPAFKTIAKGQGLSGLYFTMKNPAMIAIVGPTPVKQAANYTIGAMYAQEMLLFCALVAMIVSALHVIYQTRQAESLGLTELVRSFNVGRQAISLAVLVEISLINGLLGLFIFGLMAFFQVATITISGLFIFSLAIVLAGLLGSLMALICAQITATTSSAIATTLSVLGILYLLRASTDIAQVKLSIYNPLAWIYLTYPFTKNHWQPLVWTLLLSAVLAGFAFLLEAHRDFGAGYLPQRQGRQQASWSLQNLSGLLWRINRLTIFSWLIGLMIIALAYGSIYGDMQTFLNSNELIKQLFTQSNIAIETSFTSVIMTVLIHLASIPTIVIINQTFTEEISGRLSQFYSTKITRFKLYWQSIMLAITVGFLGLLLASSALGISALTVMNPHAPLAFSDFLKAGLNGLAAHFVFIGLAALLLGWFPNLRKISYLYLGYAFSLNYFGQLLDLPKWLMKTTPFGWLPAMPLSHFEGTQFSILLILGILLMGLGYYGYRVRDFIEIH